MMQFSYNLINVSVVKNSENNKKIITWISFVYMIKDIIVDEDS